MHRDLPLFCRVELFSSLLWWMSVTIRDSNTCVYRLARVYTHKHRRDSPLWSLGTLLPLFITVVCVSRGRWWWWWWIIDLPDHVLFRSITFLADIIIYSIITKDHVVCIQFCVCFFFLLYYVLKNRVIDVYVWEVGSLSCTVFVLLCSMTKNVYYGIF